jgi:hypothetical protein
MRPWQHRRRLDARTPVEPRHHGERDVVPDGPAALALLAVILRDERDTAVRIGEPEVIGSGTGVGGVLISRPRPCGPKYLYVLFVAQRSEQ